MGKKFLMIIIGILIGGLALSYLAYQTGYQAGFEGGKVVGRAAGQTELGDVVGNPLEDMPSANPFEKVINPFKDLYQNPFK